MSLSTSRLGSEPSSRPGVLAGARALLLGLRWLGQRRDLWPLAALPALLTLGLGTAGGGTGLYLGYHYTYKLLAPHAGLNLEGILTFLLALLLSLIAAALGMLLGTSLAVPLSGPTLERTAAAMRVHLGLPAPPEQGLRGFTRSLAATALTWLGGLFGVGLLTLLGVLVPFVTPVTLPLKGVLLALLLTFDLGDPAFNGMGMSLSDRLLWLRTHLAAALGFGALAVLLLGVPVLGLFVLPAAVAGVTSLVGSGRPKA